MITLDEQEFQQLIEQIVSIAVPQAVSATLRKVGIPTVKDWEWVTQSEASRLLGKGKVSAGRRKLEKGLAQRKVRWEKIDMGLRTSRVLVNLSDVRNLMRSAL
jgi:tRNA G10  N-methylase Trm11